MTYLDDTEGLFNHFNCVLTLLKQINFLRWISEELPIMLLISASASSNWIFHVLPSLCPKNWNVSGNCLHG